MRGDRSDDARWFGGDRVMDWARGARAGESLVYGLGDRLPPAALETPRRLAEIGLVDVVRQRRGRGFAFIVQRRAAPFVDPATARRRPSRGPVRPAESLRGRATERALLKLLIRSARAGHPCPSDRAIAQLLGLSGRKAASYRLHRLVARGLIAIDQPHPWGPRTVTIIASGLCTAGPCGSARP